MQQSYIKNVQFSDLMVVSKDTALLTANR